MFKIKKRIATVFVVTLLLMTVLLTSAVSVGAIKPHHRFRYEVGFKGVYTNCEGNLAVVAFADGMICSTTKEAYINSCKYASCTSYRYVARSDSFVQQHNVRSGYVNTQRVSTYDKGNLYIDADTVKKVYYCELHRNGSSGSERVERTWVTKYKNVECAMVDPTCPSGVYNR